MTDQVRLLKPARCGMTKPKWTFFDQKTVDLLKIAKRIYYTICLCVFCVFPERNKNK